MEASLRSDGWSEDGRKGLKRDQVQRRLQESIMVEDFPGTMSHTGELSLKVRRELCFWARCEVAD